MSEIQLTISGSGVEFTQPPQPESTPYGQPDQAPASPSDAYLLDQLPTAEDLLETLDQAQQDDNTLARVMEERKQTARRLGKLKRAEQKLERNLSAIDVTVAEIDDRIEDTYADLQGRLRYVSDDNYTQQTISLLLKNGRHNEANERLRLYIAAKHLEREENRDWARLA